MSEGDSRLARIESKLDKLTDVVVQLATIEERQTALNEGLKRLGGRTDDHEKRLRPLENKLATVGWIERVVWIIIALGVTQLIK